MANRLSALRQRYCESKTKQPQQVLTAARILTAASCEQKARPQFAKLAKSFIQRSDSKMRAKTAAQQIST